MSTRSFLTAGLDLSLLPSEATNAQILQAIQEAKPASGLGLLIYQSATPDVATYTEYATFIWINTSTGELKYWNGSSWQLISGKATITDASVTISKLSVTGGTALQLIRINAGATAFEFVNPGDLFASNSFPLAKLVNAVSSGYIVYSGVGGVWASSLLTTILDSWLAAKDIPLTDVVDTTGIGLPNQVAYLPDTFDPLSFAYVESLLRNNQTPTSKLLFAAGAAGKFAKVNAGGTDLEYTSSVGTKAGVLKYTGVSATAPQAIAATTETVVEWNSEVDTEGAISSFDAATDRFTLDTGTYLLDISVPFVMTATGASSNISLILFDVTGATIIATANGRMVSGGNTGDNSTVINLKHPVKVTSATNVFSVKIYASVAGALGTAISGAYAETYQQMSILKLT